MKILILGGYGIFGGRLAHLLVDEERLTLLISGRSIEKAEAFCKQLPAGAQRFALAFNRNKDVESQIRNIKPDLVVDATGPFQSYGKDPYRVVKACIANKIHYMDLADGSDFVNNVSQFDKQAKDQNIFILSGVSSFPVLTAAVVRRLSKDLTQVVNIKGGIAPSPYAIVGLNVIRAIAIYSGKRLPLIRDKSFGYALTETMRYTISPPGFIPLRNTLFSLVDVPDLQALPAIWTDLDSIWMGAGPVPEILHRMLIGLAWLVRIKLLPTLSPLAPLFHFVINILRRGEHRGGMFVLIEGLDANGKKVERSWHLLAEGDDGPFIPSMAVESLVRRMLSGSAPKFGARPATQDLELEDYEKIFQRRAIYTGQREQREDMPPAFLYQRLLGGAWESLPAPIVDLHSCKAAEGRAKVEIGENLFARLIVKIFSFPNAGRDIPVQVSFQTKDGGEDWRRAFAGKSFSSFQSEGRGLADKLLSEKFRAFTFDLALVAEPEKLSLIVRRWRIFGIPLPLALSPLGNSSEYVENGKFRFHVEIKHPLIGLIVRYQGWLTPKE